MQNDNGGDSGGDLDDKPLEEFTANQLKEIAKNYEISGYGSMSKAELIEAIRSQESSVGDDEDQ